MGGNTPVRDPKSKWFVDENIYSGEMYPDFCSGSSYVMKASDAEKIYSTSKKTNFFWIDDVFVTGILREKYNLLLNSTGNNLDILDLNNDHHLGDKREILDWCSKGLETSQLNFIFILLNKKEFVREMFCIWNKVRLMRYAMNTATNS